MVEETSPDETNETDDALEPSMEEQLATYARDLQQLFRANRGLQREASESEQMRALRSNEVSTLNTFLHRHLSELFEMESEYEELLDRLAAALGRIEPLAMRETAQGWVTNGRAFLNRIREERA